MLLDDGLTMVQAGELLARRGIVVPQRTLHRYALEALGRRCQARRGVTVRVAGQAGADYRNPGHVPIGERVGSARWPASAVIR